MHPRIQAIIDRQAAEFTPVVDTDRIGYETLAKINPELLDDIRRFIGNNWKASQVKSLMERTFGTGSTVVDLAIGAAYYIEQGRDKAVQAICPRCHQQLGTNYRNCTTCYRDVEGRA